LDKDGQSGGFFQPLKRIFFRKISRETANGKPDLPQIRQNSIEENVCVCHLADSEIKERLQEFKHTLVKEVMVPRTSIRAIEINDSVENLIRIILDYGHSRIPVYHQNLDSIEGIIHAKNLLKYWNNNQNAVSLTDVMRQAFFVPETKKIDGLLHDFREHKSHMAIVIDEYGGTAGLVTIEDIVEEIFGEIEDEYDRQTEKMVSQPDGSLLADADTEIDLLETYYKTEIPRDDFTTIGGFIIHHIGRIPLKGEKMNCGDFTVEIISANAKKISKVKIWPRPEEQEPVE
jgi:magnesium and cobalt transporter